MKLYIKNKDIDFSNLNEEQIRDIIIKFISSNIKDQNKYFNGNISDLYDPFELSGIKEGLDLIQQKIKNNKSIRIIGDYDVDGICSTYILMKGFKYLNVNVDYKLPDRIKDGYGINKRLIDESIKDKIDLIITCDNGISAIDDINYAIDNGISVIITDHHKIIKNNDIEVLPKANIIINPHQKKCKSKFKDICGAVVAFKFISTLINDKDLINEFIIFAGIATICDVMPLIDENRIIVKEALKLLKDTKNKGLKSLIKNNYIDINNVKSYDIGFTIGPQINACGRIDSPYKALDLFFENDELSANIKSNNIIDINQKRKALTLKESVRAINIIKKNFLNKNNILIVYLENCNEGIVGIVASNIADFYNKPTFLMTNTINGIKGSARSVEGYDLFKNMIELKDLFLKFGGHKMAAGFSIKEENISKLNIKINELNKNTYNIDNKIINIDFELPIDNISYKLINDIEYKFEPFGEHNKYPLFISKNSKVTNIKIISENRVIFYFIKKDGTTINGIYFNKNINLLEDLKTKYGENLEDVLNNKNSINMSVVYYFNPNFDINNSKKDDIQINIIYYK